MPIPFNREAEQAVLGAILLDKHTIYKIIDLLEPEDFYLEQHRHVYQAMLDDPEAIDLVALNEKVKDAKLLAEIAGGVITTSDVVRHARIVKDKSLRRQLLQASTANLEIINNENKEIEAVLAEVQNSVLDISTFKKQDDTVQTALVEVDDLQKLYEEKAEHGQDLLGYSCGFSKIDEATDGLRPHHVWVVGAWSSTGKTQFALNIVNTVLAQEIPSAIISLEMSKVDMIARLLAIKTGVNARRLLKGFIDKDKVEELKSAKEFLKNSPLFLHTDYFDLQKIKYVIRKDAVASGVKFFVVDYLQNIRSDGREYDMLTRAAIELQSLARELDITLLLVSQVSNEAHKGQGAGAGFKGSGHIEAVADLAIRLKRDKENEALDSDGKVVSPVKVMVDMVKNRHGITGSTEFGLWLESGIFEQDYNPLPEALKSDI